MLAWVCLCLVAAAADEPTPASTPYFEIQVVDEATGRGVPLVELRTVNRIRLVTDSQGYAAFLEPGLMDQKVFFTVEADGYEHAADGFGYRGRALLVSPSGTGQLTVRRTNIAERLYRVTGGGIYRDSLLLGKPVPAPHPAINARVLGQDSVLNAVYHGRVYWFWGDTSRPAYPLGNFHVPGATSPLPANGLDPDAGIPLDYFVDDETGFARETCNMPGQGPTWAGGLVVLNERGQGERMYAGYAKIKIGSLDAWQRGLVVFDDKQKRFEKVCEIPLDHPLYPQGHTLLHKTGDTEYVHFTTPYPYVRVPARAEAYRDVRQYEAFTYLVEGCPAKELRLDRDANGVLRLGWKRNTRPVTPAEEAKLLTEGRLTAGEAVLPLRDRDTGKPVRAHSGTVYWNAYRRRWILIAQEVGGRSLLGEIWYAEADTPLGPWVYAVNVVSHAKYSFYNPKQHPMFDRDNGRVIYFEGTYSTLFSGVEVPTPRYDYNQILYKLSLDDPRLILPVPVYATGGAGDPPGPTDRLSQGLATGAAALEASGGKIAFWAFDRPAPGSVPVVQVTEARHRIALRAGPGGDDAAAFHALPADAVDPPAPTTPLYEFRAADGRRLYSTDREWSIEGFERSKTPVCRVWVHPIDTRFLPY
jgi:hypothetical protein